MVEYTKKCEYCGKPLFGKQQKFCCDNHRKYYYRKNNTVNNVTHTGNYIKANDFNKFQEEVLQALNAANIRLDDVEKQYKILKEKIDDIDTCINGCDDDVIPFT